MKRVPYDDARNPETDTYVREVWVTLHTAEDVVTVEHQYFELPA